MCLAKIFKIKLAFRKPKIRWPKLKFGPKSKVAVLIILCLFLGIIGGIFGGLLKDKFLEKFGGIFWPSSALEEKILQKISVQEESATIAAVQKAIPSVVSIAITKDLSKYFDKTGPNIFPFDDFFEFNIPFEFAPPSSNQEEGEQQIGGGTGFIISENGMILTNRHVVQDEEAEYSVILNDGKRYDARVLAQDPFLDVAIVKIDARGLTPLPFGDSDTLQIGQTVIAIGYTLSEFKNTVTKGIISGINRRVEAGAMFGGTEVLEQAIQTDAAINPGNSGGPLLNLIGEAVGINTAISQAGQLVGFAIPVNSAKEIIESIQKFGRIIRPWLGVRYTIINKRIAEANHLPVDYGALIVRGENVTDLAVAPGSPADKAGLVENDIILKVDNQKVDIEHTLASLIAKYKTGDKVKLEVFHKGDIKKVEVILGEFPAKPGKK